MTKCKIKNNLQVIAESNRVYLYMYSTGSEKCNIIHINRSTGGQAFIHMLKNELRRRRQEREQEMMLRRKKKQDRNEDV